jgi:hypothetical protein
VQLANKERAKEEKHAAEKREAAQRAAEVAQQAEAAQTAAAKTAAEREAAAQKAAAQKAAAQKKRDAADQKAAEQKAAEQTAREQTAREQTAQEQVEREAAEQKAREQTARDAVKREPAEQLRTAQQAPATQQASAIQQPPAGFGGAGTNEDTSTHADVEDWKLQEIYRIIVEEYKGKYPNESDPPLVKLTSLWKASRLKYGSGGSNSANSALLKDFNGAITAKTFESKTKITPGRKNVPNTNFKGTWLEKVSCVFYSAVPNKPDPKWEGSCFRDIPIVLDRIFA